MGELTRFEAAERRISNAWWAALISAGVTVTFALISVGGDGEPIAGIDAWAFLDVALILGLAYGLSRKSRACAVILLVYFVGGKILMWTEAGNVRGLPVALLFMYFFAQGVVGTFQYHSIEGEAAGGQPAYRPTGGTKGAPWIAWMSLASIVLVAAGGAWYFKPSRQLQLEAAKGPTRQDIEASVAAAVGRLNRVEISGSLSPLSTAVAVEEGVMLVPCQGISPGAHLLVKLGAQDVQAKLELAEERIGLCKVTLKDRGSFPLPLAPAAPKVGDAVFAASFDPGGKVVLTPGQVRKVTAGARGTVIESSARTAQAIDGSPLLDASGRLVAVSLEGRDTTLPAAWTAGSR